MGRRLMPTPGSGSEIRPLDTEEIDEILRNLEGEEVVLVGGQAVIAWARYFEKSAGSDLQAFGPYASMDLDLLGSKEVARRFSRKIGGRFKAATLNDLATSNAATVTYRRNNRSIVVDFLTGLLGVATDSLEDETEAALEIEMTRPGDNLGDNKERRLRVLHPLLVLQSKIANVVGILHRTDPSALNQMRAAEIILQAYLLEVLDTHHQGGATKPPKDAQRTVEDLKRLIASPEADAAFETYGVDLVSILEAVAPHPAWRDRFRTFQIERQIPILRAKRARRIAERARKRGAQPG